MSSPFHARLVSSVSDEKADSVPEAETNTPEVAADSDDAASAWEALPKAAANDAPEGQTRFTRSRLFETGLRISDETPAQPAETEVPAVDDAYSLEVGTRRPLWVKLATAAAALLSVAWVALCVFFAGQSMGWDSFILQVPHQMGGLLAGALAPVAIFWLAFGYALRADDARIYGEALKQELQSLIFPTEERSQRISTDIQKLCDQAAELATTSKTLLKAMSHARQGVQQEIRAYAALTQKTEFHLDRLAETLQERGQSLVGLTADLETRVAKIGGTTELVVTGWKEASQSVMAGALQLEGFFDKGVQGILEAADQARAKTSDLESDIHGRFESIVGTIDTLSTRLQAVGGQFERHAETLKGSTEAVGAEVGKLSHTIETNVMSFETVTQNASQAMANSSQMLLDQREQLNDGIEKLIDHSHKLASVLGSSVADINRSADSLAARAGTVEERLGSQADRIAGAVEAMTDKAANIEQAGDSVVHRLSEALSMALSGASQISDAVSRSAQMIDRARQDAFAGAGDFTRTAQAEIETLTRLIGDYQSNANALKLVLTGMDHTLASAMTRTIGDLSGLDDRLQDKVDALAMTGSDIESRLIHSVERFADPLDNFATNLQNMDIKFHAIDEAFDRRTVLLTQAADQATAQADQIRERLKAQAMDLSSVTGQIAAHLRAVEQQLNTERLLVAKTSTEAQENVDAFVSRVRQATGQLSNSSADIEAAIRLVDEKLQSQSAAIDGQVQESLVSVDVLAQRLQDLSSQMHDDLGAVGSRLLLALDDVGSAGEDTQTILETALTRAQEVATRFDALKDDYQETVDANLRSVETVAARLDDTLTVFDAGTDEALKRIKDSSDAIKVNVEGIKDAADTAELRLESVQSNLERRAQDLHLMTDQAVLKSESLQKAMDRQFQDLSMAVGNASEQLREAGDAFVDTAALVGRTADGACLSINTVSREAELESAKLRNASDEVLDHTRALVASLEREAADLLRSTSQALQDIKRIGDSLSIRAREVDEHLKSSLASSQQFTQQAKAQAVEVTQQTREANIEISNAIAAMADKARDIGKIVTDVQERIDGSRTHLEAQTEHFGAVAKEAAIGAEESAQVYQRQASVLLKASQDTQQQLDRIRDMQARAQRETFLSSARFMLETLHSLAVDFARTLDLEGQERLWKTYQKGDIASFTRRLVELGDDFPKEKVRSKYSADGEFRTYVQKYFRLFDDLLDQAGQTDMSDMLGWTFLTSDAGRLYTLLGQVLGRSVREIKDIHKAA